ncbi:hypothetical protein Taro_006026 [Colocasia esculenta]|uniref:Uncharacterized protein n=1 Tax=Colocasia esculenta TaxID=4460 RepID=A0A843TUQ1_COLES|nr:hypothetical protein [Colocasia esculenta]
MIRPSSKLSNQKILQTDIQVIDAIDDAASTLCSIALPSTVLEKSKQHNEWMGPMLKLSLPNFRVRTVEPAMVSRLICDKHEESHGDEKTSEASTEPREIEERDLSISVLLSKPILALEFSCLKMHVEAPTILSSHGGRTN